MKQKTNITSLPKRDSKKDKDEKSIVSSLSNAPLLPNSFKITSVSELASNTFFSSSAFL